MGRHVPNKQELALREARLKDHILHSYLNIANDKSVRPALRMMLLDRVCVIVGIFKESVIDRMAARKRLKLSDFTAVKDEQDAELQAEKDAASRHEQEWQTIQKGGSDGKRTSQ